MSVELAIVGAGPAGVTAALWARTFGLDPLLLEAGERPGGQLHRVYSSLAGVPGVLGDGASFAATLARQLAEAGIAVRRGAEATALVVGEHGCRIVLADQEPVAARAILIATGLRPRTLGVPGERELAGHGVSNSGRRDRERYAGQPVMVVGGGDAAYENALLLAEVGCPVTLVVRGAPRVRAEFRERVAAASDIVVLERTRVVEFLGGDELRAVKIAGPDGERLVEVAAVVVKVGPVPNTEWCRDVLAHDAEGYLRVDPRGATSRAGVWAVGDVTRPPAATVSTAAAASALALGAIRQALRG